MSEMSINDTQKYDYNAPKDCEECGGALKYRGIGEYICEKCGHIMYDDYGKVRNYLEVNIGATVGIVARATGVSERVIKNMLREDKLQIREDSRTFMKCDACGKDIISGRYCEQCAKIAAAAYNKKKQKEALEEKKKEQMGILTDYQRGDTGRKRFMGNDE